MKHHNNRYYILFILQTVVGGAGESMERVEVHKTDCLNSVFNYVYVCVFHLYLPRCDPFCLIILLSFDKVSK